jgi:prepilin-type N-terminal cleavage/methylation domain-containing protein
MLRKISLRGRVRDQRGFTLIEIIAVLVILAVLAVVAVPKYLSTIQEAKNKAAIGAIAEAQARASQTAARTLLTSGTMPSSITVDSDFGDFTLTPLTYTNNIGVTATGKTGTNVDGGTATGTIRLPSS